jgi:uncharacterized cupredoxin-like copper-binding protein
MRTHFVLSIGTAALLALAATVTVSFTDEAGAHTTFAAGKPGNPKRKTSRTIEIVANEGDGKMFYTPDRIEVRRGEQIRFIIRNEGALAHELLLDSIEGNAKHKKEMEKNPEMEHDDPNGKRLEPKKTAEILWLFDKVGTFEYACLIPGHYDAGMKGIVVVTAAKSRKAGSR